MAHRFIHVLYAVIFVLAFPVLSYTAGDDIFFRQQLSVNGEILGCRQADFNGDSLTDIALVGEEDNSGKRFINIYIQRESGRFPPSPSQQLILSSSVNMVQAVDMNGDGKSEIVVVDNQGVSFFLFGKERFAEKPRRVISRATIFSGGIHGSIVSQQFIFPISGRLVCFLPVAEGITLYDHKNGQFVKSSDLRFSHLLVESSKPVKLFVPRRTVYSMTLPEITLSDYNRDGLTDIYLLWPTELIVFPQKQRGRFDNENLRTFVFSQNSPDNFCQSSLIDFDRDGFLDVVCSYSLGGLSDAKTEIRFFGASQISNNDSIAQQLVTLTDVCGNLLVRDLDGVNGPELIVPAVEVGILTTVKNMISKKTDFYFLIYPIDNLGRPSKEPQIRRKVTCRLDFEHADPTDNFRINWTGDYNHDGILDLVVADGEQLMFYSGIADEYIEKRAGLVLDMSNVESILTAHLNNDDNTDLIIVHKRGTNTQKITLLVTNRIY